MLNIPRERIEVVVRNSIGDITGRDPDEIKASATLLGDLGILSDDLSLVFVPTVEKTLGVKVDPVIWRSVSTVAEAISAFECA